MNCVNWTSVLGFKPAQTTWVLRFQFLPPPSPNLVLTRVCCLTHNFVCCVVSRSFVSMVFYRTLSLCIFRSLPRDTHLSAKRWTIFATAVKCKKDVDRCLLGSGLTSASCPCCHFVKFHVEADLRQISGFANFWCSGFRYAGLICAILFKCTPA